MTVVYYFYRVMNEQNLIYLLGIRYKCMSNKHRIFGFCMESASFRLAFYTSPVSCLGPIVLRNAMSHDWCTVHLLSLEHQRQLLL